MAIIRTFAALAASLVSGAGAAAAADLPSRQAAPVEFVRICPQFGGGFFTLPGSDTCLKVGGRIRTDFIFNEPFSRSATPMTFRARGYLAVDSFTATDWGPLRATTRFYVQRDSGRSGAGAVAATTDVFLDWAYIQFAGFTAGRVAISFFEFAPFGGTSFVLGQVLGRGSDYQQINVFAYTASLGSGFSATVALEDGVERRIGIASGSPTFLTGGGLAATPAYAGQALPDVIGRLDYKGDWGSAALTTALHQTRTATIYGPSADLGETAYGYAIQLGAKINLPFLAAGDQLSLQAAYASGANSYTGWTTTGAGSITPIVSADVIYDTAGNSHASRSWSFTGGLLHYWLPSVRQSVFAAYGGLDQWGRYYDAAAVSVGTNLIWTPAKGFDIGGEIGYSRLTEVQRAALPLVPGSDRDNYFGRIRFQRDF